MIVLIELAIVYELFSVIVGLQMQVLWAVSLSDCCCACP